MLKYFLIPFMLISSLLYCANESDDPVFNKIEKTKILILNNQYNEAKLILEPLFNKHVKSYYTKSFKGDKVTGFYNLQLISYYLALIAFLNDNYTQGFDYCAASTGIIGIGWYQSWFDYYDKFISSFEKKYRKDHKALSKLYYLIAVIDNYLGDSKKELKYLRKAAKINQDNFQIIVTLARTYFDAGEIKKSKKYFLKSIEINPNDGKALSDTSMILNLTGEYKKALEVIEKSFKINPNDLKTRINYSLFLYVNNNSTKAEEVNNQSIILFPDQKEYLKKASLYFLLDQKKYSDALKIVKTFSKNDLKQNTVFKALAIVTYAFNNNSKLAKKLLIDLTTNYQKAKDKEFLIKNWSFRRNILNKYMELLKELPR